MADELHQYIYKRQFTRPEVRIKKDDNENIKAFLHNKGYNSINDYINTLIYADMQYNIIPNKADVLTMYPVEQENQ